MREVRHHGPLADRGRRAACGPTTGRDAVDRAMERLGVADLARGRSASLSGGQRQRALVAQGLAQEATLLLLDEPITGLDLASRERILEVMAEERAAGRTVVAAPTPGRGRRGRPPAPAGRPGRGQGPPDEVLTEANL